jgi:hypothetical protein
MMRAFGAHGHNGTRLSIPAAKFNDEPSAEEEHPPTAARVDNPDPPAPG